MLYALLVERATDTESRDALDDMLGAPLGGSRDGDEAAARALLRKVL